MSTKKELRVINIPTEDIQLRESQDGLPTISGYTAVFNQETQIGSGKYGFREVIRPGFFTRAIEEQQDVRALFNHDSNFLLGRTKSGTLRLREDSQGLYIEVDPSDTQAGRDVVTSIRRGDVDGMSFAFTTSRTRWEESDEEESPDLRELLEIDTLYDVGPVVYPAYEQTSATVSRSYRTNEEIFAEELGAVENPIVNTKKFRNELHITLPSVDIPKSIVVNVPKSFRIDLPNLSGTLSGKDLVEQKRRARERELELLELEN